MSNRNRGKARGQEIQRRGQPEASLTVEQVAVTRFAGPLPHPEILEHYERIVPGAADRIIRQWEEQSKHRQHIEKQVVGSNVDNSRRGQHYTLILALVIFVLAVWLLATGQGLYGLTLLVGEMVALAGVFIVGRWTQKRERDEKASKV